MVSLALCAATFIFKLSSTFISNPESLSFVSQYVKDLVATLPQDCLLQAFWAELLHALFSSYGSTEAHVIARVVRVGQDNGTTIEIQTY